MKVNIPILFIVLSSLCFSSCKYIPELNDDKYKHNEIFQDNSTIDKNGVKSSDNPITIRNFSIQVNGEPDNLISDEDNILLQTIAVDFVRSACKGNYEELLTLCNNYFYDQIKSGDISTYATQYIWEQKLDNIYQISYPYYDDGYYYIHILFECLEIKDSGIYGSLKLENDGAYLICDFNI